MNYEGILEFHGTWRSYQARVLQNVSRYLSDDKIHIVAAPGSGKTTLGIELIKRLNANTLILAPSITIREQWAARIQEAFLCDGYALEDYVSLSLKQPKAITVATYQALHSAMTRSNHEKCQHRTALPRRMPSSAQRMVEIPRSLPIAAFFPENHFPDCDPAL